MADNNNHVPMRVVQQIIDSNKTLFDQVQRSQDRTDKEINDLAGAMTTLVTNLNTVEDVNKKVCGIEEKLGESIDKTKEMVLVVKVVFAIIMLAVFAAGFGSYLLYEGNSETLTKEIVERIKIEKNIDRRDVEGIIGDYIDKLKEERDDETSN